MTERQPPIPLWMLIELVKHHDDDRLVHEVRIGLAGIKEPFYCCDIESLFGDWPHAKCWHHSDPRLEIPDRVRDHLAYVCFEILFSDLIDHGGYAASRQLRCARSFLHINFLGVEAELIADALEQQVVPGLFVDDEKSVTFG